MQFVFDLIGWNQLIAVLMGLAAWFACQTRWLSRRPALCHGLWLIVLLKLVTPSVGAMPIVSEMTATMTRTPNRPDAKCPVGCKCCDGGGSAVIDSNVLTSSPSLPAALAGFSLLVTCALWISAARQLYRARRLLRGNEVRSGRVKELLLEVAQQFGWRAPVKLLIVDIPVTPMLWAGAGCPAIVLPRQLVESLDEDALRSVIAHELTHLMRRDHWSQFIALIITTLFWWNPMAWLARRQLCTTAEECCDAVALERCASSRRTYANTLLTVVDFISLSAPKRSAFGVTFGESQLLRRRFERIADSQVSGRMPRGGRLLLAFAIAALTFLPADAREPVAIAPQLQEQESSESRMDFRDFGCEPKVPIVTCPS